MAKRIVVTAGGSGGHILPAIAIAEEFRRQGHEVLYIGNKGSMEESIAQKRGFAFAPIDVQKIYRRLTFKHFLFPYKSLKSYYLCALIFKKFKPDVCVGTGGFVSGPVALKAAKSSIPLYLQEQNSAPGLTTNVLSKYAKRIFLGFEAAAKTLPQEKCHTTGNPLQEKILSSKEKQRFSDKENSRLVILVLGGSQGAMTINREILTALPQIMAMNAKLIWQTGKTNYQNIAAESFVAELSKTDNLQVFPFTDDMNEVYDKSHIAITRAGAITLAELETKKIPSIIIPIPKSAGNHQYLNAKDFQDSGKGILLPQSKLDKESLIKALNELAANWSKYYAAFKPSRHLSAAQDIVSTILGDLNDNS